MSIDIVEGIWNGFWFLFYRSKSFIVIVIVSFHFLALDLTVCIWEVLCFVLNLHSILSIWNDIGLKQPGFESNVSRYWKKIASKDLDLPRISLPWTMSEEIFVKYHNWEKKKSVFESENIEITLETSWLYLSIAKSKSKASCKKKLLSCQWPLPNHHDQKLHKTWKRWRSNWSVFITARAQQIQDGTGDFRE